MTAPVRTTLLDAVNRIYAVIGEQPLASLTPPIPADAQAIVNWINTVHLEQLTRGWHFNVDGDVKLTADVNGKFPVSADWMRVAVNRYRHPQLDITTRMDSGVLKLYDKKNQTFVIPASTLYVEIVKSFDFEECPEAYRQYVEVRAARKFLDAAQGDVPHHQYTERDEITALQNLQKHEGIVELRTVFDSYDAFRVIDRLYPRTAGRA